MKNFVRLLFFPLLGLLRSKEKSDSATPPHANPDRLHVFCGSFPSELDATAYCLDAPSKNEPEPLTRDLPDAMIDTSEIEIIYGARVDAAMPMLDPYGQSNLSDRIGNANTLILIAEKAFGGLPYTLNDTPVLTYLGPIDVK